MTNFQNRLAQGLGTGNLTAGLLYLVENNTDLSDAISYVKEWENHLEHDETHSENPKSIIIRTIDYYVNRDSQYSQNLYNKILEVINSPDELQAIKLLNKLGYKIYKPVTKYEQVF